MAYVYLLDLYKQIDARIDDARQSLERSDGDEQAAEFERGRIDALNDMKSFLADNFNAKLPRRIRESLNRKAD